MVANHVLIYKYVTPNLVAVVYQNDQAHDSVYYSMADTLRTTSYVPHILHT